jgi:hypothetical protein
MSTTLFAFVTTENNVLADVESVEFESLDASYGILRKDTGEIVIPAGVMLDNPELGVYTFEVDDADHDFFYEVCTQSYAGRQQDQLHHVPALCAGAAERFAKRVS